MNDVAFLSDVAGNLEALVSVLSDIESRNIADIVCLGGTVFFGYDWIKCAEILMKRSHIHLGGWYERNLFTETPSAFDADESRMISNVRGQLAGKQEIGD